MKDNRNSEDRYQRLAQHKLIKLETLREATLLVAGVGALGNEVVKGLALLGIGRIILVDMDVIELSNLTRSVLFREGDVGQPKVQVAAGRARDINPDVKIKAIHGDVTRQVGLGVFRQVNAVIGCLDSMEARLGLNRLCWQAGVPLIDGSLGASGAFYGGVRTFLPPDGPCYGCSLSPADYLAIGLKNSCGNLASEARKNNSMPTTPVEAGVIGAMLVQETLKLLNQLPMQGGVGRFYNGLTWDLFTVRYERQPSCPGHEESFDPAHYSRIPERIGSLTADRLLAMAQAAFSPGTRVRLPVDLVSALDCSVCDWSEPLDIPRADVDPLRLACPTCGTLRTVRKTSLLERPGQLGASPLSKLGLPMLSAFTVEHPGGQTVWEISGDEDEFWSH